MKLDFTDILSDIILEQSREEVLLKKFTQPRKKKGKILPAIMDKEVFYTLVKADPTTRLVDTDDSENSVQKVGAYTQWIIKQYISLQQEADKHYAYGSPDWGIKLEQLQNRFMEDLYKVTEDLIKFNRFKSKIDKSKRDINRVSNPDELYDLTKDFSLEQATTTKAERVLKDAELVYDSANWEILIPKTKEASCHYGANTRWCTAGSSNNYFDYYTTGSGGPGPLYIIINKKDPSDKYQFHFASNQYKGKDDREINLPDFLNSNAELKEFFKEMFKKFLGGDGKLKDNRVSVKYPSDSMSRYIGIYGLEDFMDKLPNDIVRFDFEVSGGYGNDVKLPAMKLPDRFTQFKNLKILHVEGLLNDLPENLGDLKNLKYISFAKNPELKSLPDSLADLGSLVINLKGSPNVVIPPRLQEKDENDEIVIIRDRD